MTAENILTEEDSRRLNMTQSVREMFINELKENGVPEEKADKELIVRLMDGMDRAVLAQAKIRVEDQGNKTNGETTKLIADILAKHTVKPTGQRTESVTLTKEIEYTEPVPGETEQGISTLTYDEFTETS